MVSLTLISEPFPGIDADASRAATFELTRAIADSAPRGCGARLLIARDSGAPEFASPIVEVEMVPLNASVLPRVWNASATARPLDGEFVHAMTPLVPLRNRADDDSSQSSVLIPHALSWLAPEMLGVKEARRYRGFVKRAVKYADAVLAPTHAVAEAIHARYGDGVDVQVLPLAALPEYLPARDFAERRESMGLPESYFVTDATPGPHGRLELLFEAFGAEPQLDPLVVLAAAEAYEATLEAVPLNLRDRVRVVAPQSLSDTGAALNGALLLLQPQEHIGAGYEVLGALASGVPVVHLGCEAVAELIFDAGLQAGTEAELRIALTKLMADPDELARLRVLAEDRSKSFTWISTAWQLWELHANL